MKFRWSNSYKKDLSVKNEKKEEGEEEEKVLLWRSPWDFPGGPVVENPPFNSGNMGSVPGRRTKIPHVRLCATTKESWRLKQRTHTQWWKIKASKIMFKNLNLDSKNCFFYNKTFQKTNIKMYCLQPLHKPQGHCSDKTGWLSLSLGGL